MNTATPKDESREDFSVLCIDDEQDMLDAYRRLLRSVVDRVYTALSPEQALATIQEHGVRLLLLDLRIPGYDVIETIHELRAADPTLTIIVITGHGTISDAVAAVKAGASDFLEKPVKKVQLEARIEPLRKIHRLEREAAVLRQSLDSTFRFPAFVGSSPAISEVKSTIVQVAKTDATVMISGETGTGKEVIAQSIHAHSTRSDAPFVVVDCGSIRDSMIESELFGYKKGAFTGAVDSHPGLIRSADGGTLFLDEIGELPLEMQTKFLRVLQQREVRALGTTKAVPVNIRVVSATNKDIKQAIADGSFRADLYYRLNTVVLNVPPLRDHPEDIAELAQYFIMKHKPAGPAEVMLSPMAVKVLENYTWPGNARELENLILRTLAFKSEGTIEASDIEFDGTAFELGTPFGTGGAGAAGGNGGSRATDAAGRERAAPGRAGAPLEEGEPGAGESAAESLEEREKRILIEVIEKHNGNKKAAAQTLGIAESTLHRKLNRMGLRI